MCVCVCVCVRVTHFAMNNAFVNCTLGALQMGNTLVPLYCTVYSATVSHVAPH